MALSKKREVHTEGRVFQEMWTDGCFCTRKRPFCVSDLRGISSGHGRI